MDLQQASVWLSMVAVPFEPAILVLALRRKLWRRLPYFTAYLVVLVTVDICRLGVNLTFGTMSRAYSWFYWMTQPVQMLARGAALADICRSALGPYTGLWKLARPLLMLSATLMLAFAAIRSNSTHWIFSYLIFVERELEFAVVISLLLLLVLSRYYGLPLERPLDGIALGLGFYSSCVIIKDTMILMQLAISWWWFSIANIIAFTTTVLIWCHALWRPLPVPVRPELSSIESYEQNTVSVSRRMRDLNERLLSLMK